jgi:hypothetical protein
MRAAQSVNVEVLPKKSTDFCIREIAGLKDLHKDVNRGPTLAQPRLSIALGKAKAQFDRQTAGSTRGAHVDFQVSVTGD